MIRKRIADRLNRSDDDGMSLAEIMVTMGVMSVLMIIVTGAILQVYKTVNATDALSTAQTELGKAFQRFDRELRYASWIATPGLVGTTWYVEFAGPVVTGLPDKCYQLRLATVTGEKSTGGQGVLQLYTWTKGSPPTPATKGQTVASQILTTGVDPFFELQAAGDKPYANPSVVPSTGIVGGDFRSVYQRLRIRLTTQVGDGDATIDTTFTALNSAAAISSTTTSTTVTNACSEGRPTT
ncbi:PilW family protein [Actinoplanes sp. NPDC051494]|uniref:PilW family protein n=1 Tax=Actinoplanes sp. NPDC051494 TaxID=3363907 RepID=UPI0037B24455